MDNEIIQHHGFGAGYDDTTPLIYSQPVRNFSKRVLHGEDEDVDLVPETNMRIWYNNQFGNFAKHKHDVLEICIPIENDYKYIVNGKNFVISPGDILFIPPETLHEIECQNEGCRFIYLFSIGFLKEFYEYSFLTDFFSEPKLINESTYPNLYGKIYSAFMAINDQYFMYTNMVLEMPIYAKLLEIFSLIASVHPQFSPIRTEDAKTKSKYEKFRSLINHINSHYMDEITLEWAADYAGFSKYHFSRLFKDYTDVTFSDYLMHRRMQAARILLTDTSNTVTEIAFQTGFNNLTSFTRSFRNATGMTPSEFRQIQQANKALHAAAEAEASSSVSEETPEEINPEPALANSVSGVSGTAVSAHGTLTHPDSHPIPHSVFTTGSDFDFEDEY
ncbi:MAG: AraC family transcriptional regulator [Saccharofermentanaceae bacterium]|nr:AraC family transcriptional regulator [Saccharofermentanaceae bacterium]